MNFAVDSITFKSIQILRYSMPDKFLVFGSCPLSSHIDTKSASMKNFEGSMSPLFTVEVKKRFCEYFLKLLKKERMREESKNNKKR